MDPSKKEITNTNQYMYNKKCQEKVNFTKFRKQKSNKKSK